MSSARLDAGAHFVYTLLRQYVDLHKYPETDVDGWPLETLFSILKYLEMSDTTKTVPGESGNKSRLQGSSIEWVIVALRSPRTIKTWLRACVALTVVLVLLVDERTSNVQGQVAFFSAWVVGADPNHRYWLMVTSGSSRLCYLQLWPYQFFSWRCWLCFLVYWLHKTE